jgi:hypothetical protein
MARYLSTFLADPLQPPTKVVDNVANQFEIPDASSLKA